jgi:anti-anti-sigma regulatory factor
MADYAHFKVLDHDGVTIVELMDENLVDRLLINELQDELVAFVENERPQKLLIDFHGVTRCSTEPINALLRARKRLAPYNGSLKLCGMSNDIRQAFRILRLDGTIFEIYDARPAALAQF